MEYELEIGNIANAIKKEKAKIVLLQFPDGLKPKAKNVAEEIEKQTKATCIIWLGSCFGACDLPPVENIKDIDLVIQFGHTAWPFKNKKIKVLKF